MKHLIILLTLFSFGCASNQEAYFNAVQQQNNAYMQAYAGVENESVKFEGIFTGTISVVKPKELPKLQHIEQPKSSAEIALEWARVIVPAAGMVAGMHYNYKAIDSSNKYNSRNIESWTGNFDKTSNTSVTTTTDVSDTSVTTTTDVSDTYVTTTTDVSETTNTSDTQIQP